jgi:pyruvate formate lyase activating enzyme
LQQTGSSAKLKLKSVTETCNQKLYSMFTEAQWYVSLKDNTVQCTLCPHLCILKEGKTGFCRVRKNEAGKLITQVYGFASSISMDPIEKKPLYHFYPGSKILSLGTYGCNMKCFFCQNCTISQTGPDPDLPRTWHAPEQVVSLALKQPGNIGIAFTYNEPVVWFEYMFDIAKLAKKSGLKTVMVTNGYINSEPLTQILEYIDAFSVDLKAFNEEFYTKVTSSELEPVKETILQINRSGKHLEIINLVIPGLNDDDISFTLMVDWIADKLGKETVLHISRYFPRYKSVTEATPISTLQRLNRLAEKKLSYVYTGNSDAENNETRCLECNNILIKRHLYNTDLCGLTDDGKCRVCGNEFLKKS